MPHVSVSSSPIDRAAPSMREPFSICHPYNTATSVQNLPCNNVENCVTPARFLPLGKQKNVRIGFDQDAGHAVPPEIRLWLDRCAHCRQRGCRNAGNAWQRRIGALCNGSTRLFLRTDFPCCCGKKTASEKRLRDHFHERCGSLAPTGCSLNARVSCTPSHRRDREYEYTYSITQTARVCQ